MKQAPQKKKNSCVRYVQDVDKWVRYFVAEAQGKRNPHSGGDPEDDVFAIRPAPSVGKIETVPHDVVAPTEQTVKQAEEEIKREGVNHYKRKAVTNPLASRLKTSKVATATRDIFG